MGQGSPGSWKVTPLQGGRRRETSCAKFGKWTLNSARTAFLSTSTLQGQDPGLPQQELTKQKKLLDDKVANIDHKLEILEREQIRLKRMYKDLQDRVRVLEKHEDEMVTKSKKAI